MARLAPGRQLFGQRAGLGIVEVEDGRLRRGEEAGSKADAAFLLELARAGLDRLLRHFADPAKAYRAVPRPEVAPRQSVSSAPNTLAAEVSAKWTSSSALLPLSVLALGPPIQPVR